MVVLGGVAVSYERGNPVNTNRGNRRCGARPTSSSNARSRGSEFFIDNLLFRIHFFIVMIRWAGLAPWELEFPFPGSLTSTFLVRSTY